MDIHPHWDTGTEDQDAPSVPVTSSETRKPARPEPTRVPIAAHHVSRRPAAVTGIIAAIVIGLTYWHGWESIEQLSAGKNPLSFITASLFTAQTSTLPAASSNEVTIRITATGANPSSSLMQLGQKLTFVNGSEIPQIIEFDANLKGSDGLPLITAAIFPGARESVNFPVTTPLGIYSYTSSTDPNISGQILLQARSTPSGNADATHNAAPLTDTTQTSDGLRQAADDLNFGNETVDNFLLPVPGGRDSPTYTPPVSTGPVILNGGATSSSAVILNNNPLPQNPYTVNGNIQHPFDANGNPIPSLYNADGSLKSGSASSTKAGTVTKPSTKVTKTTDSGAGLWVLGLSLLGGVWAVRRSIRSIKA